MSKNVKIVFNFLLDFSKTANYDEKQVLLSWLSRTKNRFFWIHESKLKSVKRLK